MSSYASPNQNESARTGRNRKGPKRRFVTRALGSLILVWLVPWVFVTIDYLTIRSEIGQTFPMVRGWIWCWHDQSGGGNETFFVYGNVEYWVYSDRSAYRQYLTLLAAEEASVDSGDGRSPARDTESLPTSVPLWSWLRTDDQLATTMHSGTEALRTLASGRLLENCPVELGSGWPFRAVHARWTTEGGLLLPLVVRGTVHGGFAPEFLVIKTGLKSDQVHAVFPWKPLWPGFIANWLIYAAIWWLTATAIQKSKLRYRLIRNRCERCAHAIAPGAVGSCPECGARYSSSTPPSALWTALISIELVALLWLLYVPQTSFSCPSLRLPVLIGGLLFLGTIVVVLRRAMRASWWTIAIVGLAVALIGLDLWDLWTLQNP